MRSNAKHFLNFLNSAKSQSCQKLHRSRFSTTADPLVDRLGRRHTYLRISLTERCNLRCQYCMPAEGAPLSQRDHLLTTEETLRAAAALARIGVRKVRLTGGEPTLRKDLPHIIESISALPNIESVSMTTNGLTLLRRLVAYQRAGLQGINVSLDSLKKERYEFIARRPGLVRVLAGIDLALQLGYKPLKINTVLIRGFNDDEICDFVEMTRDREIEVRFIEFMPFSGNSWDASRLLPHEEVLGVMRKRYPSIEPVMTRPNNTAQIFNIPGHVGRVGLISSMTRPFCAGCDRIRLTADGSLKVCLFGSRELSLRPLLRSNASDYEIASAVRQALANKRPQHAAGKPATDCRHDSAEQTTRPAHGADWWIDETNNRMPPIKTKQRLMKMDHITSKLDHLPFHTYTFPRLPSISTRMYSTNVKDGTKLTHVDKDGRAKMVDVTSKPVTLRCAIAECNVLMNVKTVTLLRENSLAKGDALSVAQIAGTQAAKKTPDLIPLCHGVPLNNVKVQILLPSETEEEFVNVTIRCEAVAEARTGVEMEALTGASLAALALYDMCKAVDKRMRITNLRVIHKSGGTSGRTYE